MFGSLLNCGSFITVATDSMAITYGTETRLVEQDNAPNETHKETAMDA